MRSHIYLYVIIGLMFGFAGGCQKNRIDDMSARKEKPVQVTQNDFVRVSPREIDQNLTPEQIANMVLDWEDIPFEAIQLPSPSSVLLSRSDEDRDKTMDPNVAYGELKTYLRGRWYMNQTGLGFRKDFNRKAIHELQAGVQSFPHSSSLYQMLGQACFMESLEPETVAACQQAIHLNDNAMNPYYILGSIKFKEGHYTQAVSLFKKALESDNASESNPVTALAHFQLATSLKEMGYLRAAAREYSQSWRLFIQQRNYAQSNILMTQILNQIHLPLLALAEIHVEMGDLDLAIGVLQEGAETLPVNVDMIQLYIISLARQKAPLQKRYNQVRFLCRYMLTTDLEPEKTLETFHSACTIMGKYKSYLEELNQWHQTKYGRDYLINARLYAYALSLADQDDQARAILNEIKDNQKNKHNLSLIYRDLARSYAKTRQWPDMILSYGRLMEMEPEQTAAIIEEMNAKLLQDSDLDAHLENWQQNTKLKDSCTANYLLGHVAVNLGRNIKAENFFRRALAENIQRTDGGFVPARESLVQLLLEQERYEDALDLLTGYMDNPDMLQYAGRVNLELGRFEQAADYYRRYLKLQKDDLDALLALGEILYRQNDFANAEDILTRILIRQSRLPDVYRHLLILYLRWSMQDNLNEVFVQAAQNRARRMFSLWSSFQSEGSQKSNEVQQKKLVSSLETLMLEHPQNSQTGLILSQYYETQAQYQKALLVIEPLLEYHPHHEKLLERAAELNEKQENWDKAAQQRLMLWQSHTSDMTLLLQCLSDFRLADQPEKAASVLWEQARHHISRPDAVDILQVEAFYLYMITRQYEQAVELFQDWYRIVWTNTPIQEESEVSTSQLITVENYAWALIQSGDYNTAFELSRDFMKQFSNTHLSGALLLIRTLNIQLMYEQSRQFLDEFIRLRPDDVALRVLLYLTMIEQDQKDMVIESMQEWRKKVPLDVTSLKTMIVVLRLLGHYEEAIDNIHEYLSEKPRDETIQVYLVDTLCEAGRYEEAQEILYQHNPADNPAGPWADAWLKYDIYRGDCQKAISRLSRWAGVKDDLPVIQKMKAHLLHTCGQEQEALELQKKIVEQEPTDVDSRLQYSVLLDIMGQKHDAARQLEQLLEEIPDSPIIKNNLGFLYIQSHEQTDRAMTLLEESLRAEPESEATLDSLGWFYYKMGDFQKALDYIYQSAASVATPDAEILDHLGDIAYRRGEGHKARIYWNQALRQLTIRVRTERFLEKDKALIENKLQQLSSGEPVAVPPLFSEQLN
ncbi:MAG: tetratricopeptide repeat protein [Sedimentisphaerales bacterium]|nr:tetratricopeptide repeat protein [Sedimentisphaerales bacterium]